MQAYRRSEFLGQKRVKLTDNSNSYSDAVPIMHAFDYNKTNGVVLLSRLGAHLQETPAHRPLRPLPVDVCDHSNQPSAPLHLHGDPWFVLIPIVKL